MTDTPGLDARLTEADVEALFQAILRRPVNHDGHRAALADSGMSVRELIVQLRACDELRAQTRDEDRLRSEGIRRDAMHYRCPDDLSVSPITPRRVLLIGSCLMHVWSDRLAGSAFPCASDLYLLNGALPAHPNRPIGEYDFQIVHLPMRSVLRDGQLARLAHADLDAHKAALEECTEIIGMLLGQAMAWNRAHGLATFVMPFLLPQQNPIGRLLPRHDLRNPVFFIERLNHALSRHLKSYANAYYFDLNEVFASHGRQLVQEDQIAPLNHGSVLGNFDFEHDVNRLEPPHFVTDVYDNATGPIIEAAWQEMLAMLRAIRQIDSVKMVVIDLDDTLWRGIAAETEPDAMPTNEGWPRGFWEALHILKRRGVLLAIISQNDEAQIRGRWDRILGGQLSLDDFAIRRIDWRPKAQKMGEILATVSLLAANALYIDDNPVQRAEITAAFPGLRTLGGDPFTWRHILLWAPETQVARITADSAARTRMVQAQTIREAERGALSRADFLARLNIRVRFTEIASVTHPRFGRLLELINKTNQFNTTGQRWSYEEFVAGFATGLYVAAFDVSDIHTEYGLVGAMLLDSSGIRQFVMSCRVLGLDVEQTAIAHAVTLLRERGLTSIAAPMIETDRNLPCRHIYQRAGFTWDGVHWRL